MEPFLLSLTLVISTEPFLAEEVVGLMKAGTAPTLALLARAEAGGAASLGWRLLDRPAAPGLAARGVEVLPTRLLLELDLERFSLELPESPRLMRMLEAAEGRGASPGRSWVGARGRLAEVLLMAGVEAFTRLDDPAMESLEFLLTEALERVESVRDRGRVGVAPPEL